MVSHDYFNHTSPRGQTFVMRVVAAGYIVPHAAYSAGENIAESSGRLATPAAMVYAWMHSPGHRANILNASFHDSGIGVVAATPASLGDGLPGATCAEDFGSVARHV